MLEENLKKINKEIELACQKSGRKRDEVRLIAVSKTKPVSLIREAYDLGLRDFGENKVKELLAKRESLPPDIRWHMIGHLQTNKVRSVIGKAALIHSIDSVKLADAIDVEAGKAGIRAEGLLEVNVAGESSKYGFAPGELMELIERLRLYKNISFKGLMTVAPDVAEPEENRAVFRKLRELAVDMDSKNVDNVTMKILSMGMTGDYTVAVEEGAGLIRVGTGLFGARERLET